MQEIIDLTGQMIRFRSTASRPTEINACIAFVRAYLERWDIDHACLVNDAVPSLVVMPGRRAPVLLMSHIDVVDGSDDLFEPQVRDGRLYGRGSIDDKYAAALSLVLFKNHLERLRRSGRGQKEMPFGLLITADEETGGYKGARKALAAVETDFCIALDGGSVDKIVVKEKGILRLKLTAHGRAAHGARPWLGENAIEKLMSDYQRVKSLFDATDPDHWHRTVNLGIIKAGSAVNQVPAQAEALLDIRYTETDDPHALVARIAAQIEGEVSIERNEPLFFGGASPYLDRLLALSAGTRTGFEHGASDARFLMDFGIRGIVWGADGDLSQHSADEHLNIESLERLHGYLETFLTTVGREVRDRSGEGGASDGSIAAQVGPAGSRGGQDEDR